MATTLHLQPLSPHHYSHKFPPIGPSTTLTPLNTSHGHTYTSSPLLEYFGYCFWHTSWPHHYIQKSPHKAALGNTTTFKSPYIRPYYIHKLPHKTTLGHTTTFRSPYKRSYYTSTFRSPHIWPHKRTPNATSLGHTTAPGLTLQISHTVTPNCPSIKSHPHAFPLSYAITYMPLH